MTSRSDRQDRILRIIGDYQRARRGSASGRQETCREHKNHRGSSIQAQQRPVAVDHRSLFGGASHA